MTPLIIFIITFVYLVWGLKVISKDEPHIFDLLYSDLAGLGVFLLIWIFWLPIYVIANYR